MNQIDKDYLKIFLDAAKDVPKDIIGSRYGTVLKMMSSSTFRGIAVKFANIIGYDKLLPMIESEETYVKVPTLLAERLGKSISSSYSPTIPSMADRIANLLVFGLLTSGKFSMVKVIFPNFPAASI